MILEHVLNTSGTNATGVWLDNQGPGCFTPEAVVEAVRRFREAAWLVRANGPESSMGPNGLSCTGALPGLYPEWLGGPEFTQAHGVRFPYVSGAMARGIASTDLVIAMGRAGMLGFFGSAGLPLARIEAALEEMETALGQEYRWGCNLINSMTDPQLEENLVDLLLRRSVRRISASAYMELTPALVRYAFNGISQRDGRILRPNHVFAKISRPDVARHFMAPPPAAMLAELVAAGKLSADEARLAARQPVAEDYIVESDSGGHTDNQPLGSLFPTIMELRDKLCREFAYERPIRLGAAGGMGTPVSVASAFALGAQFVVTGSVNQATLEAGVSDEVKAMLAKACLTDFAMCPCADMFELGVKVQVLKRGTMFPVRASQLYAVYVQYASLEAIPPAIAARLEKQIFRQPLAEVWASTRSFFAERNPEEVQRAEADPKHKMALVFRWYMGSSSQWPIRGISDRAIDYQIWSGPAQGSFNNWVEGSFLEPVENRQAVQIALNLLEGAATITRANQLRSNGISVPPEAFRFDPRPLA